MQLTIRSQLISLSRPCKIIIPATEPCLAAAIDLANLSAYQNIDEIILLFFFRKSHLDMVIKNVVCLRF